MIFVAVGSVQNEQSSYLLSTEVKYPITVSEGAVKRFVQQAERAFKALFFLGEMTEGVQKVLFFLPEISFL